MVLIVSKEGQLANRLAHASAFIANSLANNYRLVHFFFEDYYPFFSEQLNQHRSLLKVFLIKDTGINKIVRSSISLFIRGMLKLRITKLPFLEIIDYRKYEQGTPVYNLHDEKFIRKAKSKIILVYGWLFRDRENQKIFREQLLKIWTPNRHFISNVEQCYFRYKKDHDVIIGVHIRRGDYKKFNNGVWFYEPEEYYRKIRELAGLKRFAGKKIAFVICTNEKEICFANGSNFDIFFEERHFVEDLYLLAKCDYIIGPPSTFSIWASYYGSVPLLMITTIDTVINDNNFQPELSIF